MTLVKPISGSRKSLVYTSSNISMMIYIRILSIFLTSWQICSANLCCLVIPETVAAVERSNTINSNPQLGGRTRA